MFYHSKGIVSHSKELLHILSNKYWLSKSCEKINNTHIYMVKLSSVVHKSPTPQQFGMRVLCRLIAKLNRHSVKQAFTAAFLK